MKKPSAQFSFIEEFVQGESHSGIWALASRGISFFNTFFVVSALSIYQYGVYQLMLVNYSFLSVFISLGTSVVNNDILRFVGDGKEPQAKKLFFEFFVWSGGISILMWGMAFFGAPLLSFRFGPEFIDLIRLFSFLFLHDALLKFIQVILIARRQFFALSIRQPLNKAFQLIILVLFFFFFRIELREVIISQISAAFLATFAMAPFAIKAYLPWGRVRAAKEHFLLPMMKTYGKWDVVRPLANKTASLLQPWTIKLLINTEALAIFTVAKTMISSLKDLFPIKTLNILIPLSVSDREKSQKIFTYGTKYLVLFAICVSLGGAVFAPLAIHLFFSQYVPSLPLFYLMLLSIPLFALGSIASTFIRVLRKQRFLFVQRVTSDTLTILFYILLVPFFGMWGLAIEYVLDPFFGFFIVYLYLRRIHSGIGFRFREMFSFSEEDRVFIRIFFKQFTIFFRRIFFFKKA